MSGPDPAPAPKRARRASEIVLSLLHAGISLLAFVLFWLALQVGIWMNAMLVLLFLLVPLTLLRRAWAAATRNLELGLVLRPLDRAMRPYLAQAANRWLFWTLLAVAIPLSLVPAQFSPEEFRVVLAILWCCVGAMMLLSLLPHRRLRLAPNLLFAAGWLFLATELIRVVLPPPPAATITLDAPFRGEWYVFNGGRSGLLNHHYPIPAQRDALDICGYVEGRTHRGDPAKLESYAAWGRELLAPADGRVVRAVDGLPDVAIGDSDTKNLAGNHVVIEIGPERYVFMAHLQRGSVRVREGQRVRRGDGIGRCGNSGNTSEPHLHLQVQSRPDFRARDLRTYPLRLRGVTLVRAGRPVRAGAVDPRRNDRLAAP